MSGLDDMRDNDEDPISTWILQHPETWDDAMSPLDERQVDAIVDRITVRATRRRRKVVATAVLSTLVFAGGAVGVAALVRSGQPTQPTAGVACREAPGVDADVIVIEPTDDPVEGCRSLWAAGRFDEAAGGVGVVPPLVACISDAGVIEVYPGDAETCTGLGLANADSGLDVENQAIVALQERLVNDINARPCASAQAVEEIARRIVDESLISGWKVEVRPDSIDATCAKAAVVATAQVVQVVKFP